MENMKVGKKRYASKLISSLHILLNAREILTFRSIRPSFIQYFLAFPLAMLFVNIQNLILVDDTRIFGFSYTTVMFLTFAIGASMMFLLVNQKNISLISKLSALITALGFVPWLFLSEQNIGVVFAMILMIGIGGCLSSSSFSFVFVLNNAERFFACVFLILSIDLIELSLGFTVIVPMIRKAIALIIISVLCISMYLSKTEDFSRVVRKTIKKLDPSIWLVLFIFFSYFAIRITGFYAYAFQHPAEGKLWGIMALVLIILFIVLHVTIKSSVWTLCNLFFISAMMSHLMWYVHLPEVAYLFSELKELGLLITLYLIGCVTNKFCDFRIHKYLILLCMTTIGILVLGIEVLHSMMLTQTLSAITAITLFVIFLMLSPVFSQYLFFADWSKEFRLIHMTYGLSEKNSNHSKQRLCLEDANLSPREKQVVSLLLRGMTLRQVAPELGLTVSTVATYSKAIYKKLGINSRSELFLLFEYPEIFEPLTNNE